MSAREAPRKGEIKLMQSKSIFGPLTTAVVLLLLSGSLLAQRVSFTQTVVAGVISPPASITVGQNLRVVVSVGIQTTGSTTVTVTSSDASKATVASTLAGAGSLSATFSSVSNGFTMYVDGVASSGTATLTISATGFTSATSTVNLSPSGFAIMSVGMNGGSQGNPPGTAVDVIGNFADATLTVCPVLLDSGLHFVSATYPTTISPGISTASVTVSSSNTSVATVGGGSLSFAAGAYCLNTATLHAVSAGSTTVSITTPAGWSTLN